MQRQQLLKHRTAAVDVAKHAKGQHDEQRDRNQIVRLLVVGQVRFVALRLLDPPLDHLQYRVGELQQRVVLGHSLRAADLGEEDVEVVAHEEAVQLLDERADALGTLGHLALDHLVVAEHLVLVDQPEELEARRVYQLIAGLHLAHYPADRFDGHVQRHGTVSLGISDQNAPDTLFGDKTGAFDQADDEAGSFAEEDKVRREATYLHVQTGGAIVQVIGLIVDANEGLLGVLQVA